MKFYVSLLVTFTIFITNAYALTFRDFKKGDIRSSSVDLKTISSCNLGESNGEEFGWKLNDGTGEYFCSRSGTPGHECLYNYKMEYTIKINSLVLTINQDDLGSYDGNVFTQEKCYENVKKIYNAKVLSWLSFLNEVDTGVASVATDSRGCYHQHCESAGLKVVFEESTNVIQDYTSYRYSSNCPNNL